MGISPVLFLIFNRPDTTKLVFDQIRKSKPKKLYIAADGPRKGNSRDVELCKQARLAVSEVDWDCEVKRLYRDKNLGCNKAVTSAIDWLFKNEEAGIILEDDCMPNQSFFEYMTQALNFYSNDQLIFMVSGSNHLFNQLNINTNSYFSKIYSVWGWGTWRRVWSIHKKVLGDDWESVVKKSSKIWLVRKYYESVFGNFTEKTDTWDVQWCYTGLKHNLLSVVSVKNTISNIGHVGSHSVKRQPFHGMPTGNWERSKPFPKRRSENVFCSLADIINVLNNNNTPITRLFSLSRLLF